MTSQIPVHATVGSGEGRSRSRGRDTGVCFWEQQFVKPAAMALVLMSLGTIGWVSVMHVDSAAAASGLRAANIMGIRVVNPSDVVAQAFSFPNGRGVLIAQVLRNGLGAKAGLQVGDGITAVNEQSIRSPEDIAKVLAAVETGDFLKLSVFRGGLAHDLLLPMDSRGFK